MRLVYAIERMTEISNITDDLEDDAATVLIDWGAAKARQLATNDQIPDDTVHDLLGLMRMLNRLATVPVRPEEVDEYVQGYADLFGLADVPETPTISDQSPLEIIQLLTNLPTTSNTASSGEFDGDIHGEID
jgi:hypothetical protein